MLRARRRFYRSVYMAALLIAFLFAIDLVTDGRINWFYWPALGLSLWVAISAGRIIFPGDDDGWRRHRR
ncbi:MAG: 2TM domain-containing protein [Alphaproteobacteria bacterium]|nr:2TM domain-containing protein [Alphaproteobacteria bacterium]